MSHPPVTAAPTGAALPAPASVAGRARSTIVALVLTIGAFAVAGVLVWQPFAERNDFSYAALAPVRDTAWIGSVIDGLGFAAVGIGLGLAVCLLVRARGAAWANVGAVLTAGGGVAFCAGMYAMGVLAWFVTAADVVPVETGTALMDYVDENFVRVGVLQVVGFLSFTVGVLVLMVALWRSRSVPRWLPITIAALTLVAFFLGGTALEALQAVQMLSLAAVAWFLLRSR